jgi:hypothetical protein
MVEFLADQIRVERKHESLMTKSSWPCYWLANSLPYMQQFDEVASEFNAPFSPSLDPSAIPIDSIVIMRLRLLHVL